MKIAIFTDVLSKNMISGVVIESIKLSRALAEKGHKVFVVAPRASDNESIKQKNVEVLTIPSVPIVHFPGFRLSNLKNKKILEKLRKEKVDVIIIETTLSIGFVGIKIAKKLGIPLVGTFHTSARHFSEAILLGSTALESTIWKFLAWFYNKCDLVTSPSKDMLEEMMKNGISGRKNMTISNGIDMKKFDNSSSKKVKEKYNKDGDLLLYVGRVSVEKNVLYLLEVFKIISEKSPKTKLLFVGDGPQMKEFKEKVNELNLQKKVIIKGKIPHEKLLKSGFYGASKVFVSASMTEVQSLTFLESQANGLPSVAIDSVGIRSSVKDNVNGFLVKNGDKKGFAEKVIELLEDESLYKKMKMQTLKEVKKDDLNEVIGIWENELSRLIEENKEIHKYKESRKLINTPYLKSKIKIKK